MQIHNQFPVIAIHKHKVIHRSIKKVSQRTPYTHGERAAKAGNGVKALRQAAHKDSAFYSPRKVSSNGKGTAH